MLKSKAKSMVFNFLVSILSLLGFSITRKKALRNSELSTLTSHSSLVDFFKDTYELSVVYDIGSHKGLWTESVQNLLPRSRFYLFDVNHFFNANLDKSRVSHLTCLLSNSIKEVMFYSKLETGDSYYKEISKNYSSTEVIQLKTTTLDECVISNSLDLPDLMKLDTQGSELDILEGAKNVLSKCKIIICEVPIVPYNLNAPKMDEYLSKLESLGYLPVSICEAHKHKKSLVQLDIVFVKRELID